MRIGSMGYGYQEYQNGYMGRQSANPFNGNYGQRQEAQGSKLSEDTRKMVRSLYQSSLTNERAKQRQEENAYMTTGSTSSSDDKKLPASKDYNYKEVANKIKQAKTSASAGQAVIAAKRKVMEIKRKIAGNQGDAKELQLALTHAERMEMAARKKKHHLELEELADSTRKRDEQRDQMEEAARNMQSSMVDAKEEEISKAEDAIFDERSEMMDEAMESMEDGAKEVSDDMLQSLNELISEFGEDELRELEEAMEQLESMEIINPHMSEEDLEELKRKHRAAEMKAMMKADMDYLKDMIKHTMAKAGSVPGMSAAGMTGGVSAVFQTAAAEGAVQAAMPADAGASMPAIDIQV